MAIYLDNLADEDKTQFLDGSLEHHEAIFVEVKNILESFENDMLLSSSVSVELTPEDQNQKRRRVEYGS